MSMPSNAIVVAIGPDGYEAAVDFAVTEAGRTGRPLHLIHVLEAPSGGAYASVYDAMLNEARSTLDVALLHAKSRAGANVVVTAELVEFGRVVNDLPQHTDAASMLVLQHRAMNRLERALGSSTVLRLAGRAGVPVISVPDGWGTDRPVTGVVTAGVQDAVEAWALLGAGFEEAKARRAELVVLHAWWLASGYDVVAVDDAMREEYATQFRQELEPVLAPLRKQYPDVDVKVLVRHAPRVEAVLDAAEVSDLLVLGRRHHLLPLGSHLGPIARAALGRATSPVLITPEATTPGGGAPSSERLARIGVPEGG